MLAPVYLPLTVDTELLQPPFSSSKLLSYFFLVGSFTCHTHLDPHWISLLIDLPLYTIMTSKYYRDDYDIKAF